MKSVVTLAQMRAADEYTVSSGVSSETLMRRAGEALFNEVIKCADGKKITVVCGTGNNGGDGYVCARMLKERGYPVQVYALCGKPSFECQREKDRYYGAFTHDFSEVVLDCIFGTGLNRQVSGGAKKVINAVNSSGAYVISADIPSGLNGENGMVLGTAIKADKTVAIEKIKCGELLFDGLDYSGEIIEKPIGINFKDGDFIALYEDSDIKKFLPKRRRNSHKGTYGTAGLVGGTAYKGALVLSLRAMLSSGCGIVKLTSGSAISNRLVLEYPQVVYQKNIDLDSTAIAVGMGGGVCEGLKKKVEFLLKNYTGTLIIDADGLNVISKYDIDLSNRKCALILTPHIKEFSRLIKKDVSEILNRPLELAKEFSQRYGLTLVLKSASTIICGDEISINTRGTSALSKGGSGDMLSGLICSFAAQGLSPYYSAVCATYLLGTCAEECSKQKTDFCVTANDIINNLHFAFKRLTDI